MSLAPFSLTLGALSIGSPSTKHTPGPQLVAVQPTLQPTSVASVPSSLLPMQAAAPAVAVPPGAATPIATVPAASGPSSGTAAQVLANSATPQPLEQALLGGGASATPGGTPAPVGGNSEQLAFLQQHAALAQAQSPGSGFATQQQRALAYAQAHPMSNADFERMLGSAQAGMAYAQAHSSLQAPINPSGQASTLGQQYWVPNDSTIADVTGYTGPQIGSGLYRGAFGEPDLPS